MSQFIQNASYEGLNTITVNIPSTDIYNFQGRVSLPVAQSAAVSAGPGGGAGTGTGGAPTVPSQVVITINQNGSPVYTGAAGVRGFTLNALSCTAGDVITIVPSSSLAQDKQQPNSVKITLSVSEGPI